SNQAATGSNSLTGLLNSLTGGGTSAATGDSGISSNAGATIGTPFNWAQNFAAASSDMLDLAQGQYAPQAQGAAGSLGLTGDLSAAAAPVPAGGAGVGAMPP